MQLPAHRPIAWVLKLGVEIVTYEIEKRRELGKLDPPGERFVSFGEAVPKCEDVFRGDLINGTITEFPDIPLDVGPVGSHWIALKKLYPRKAKFVTAMSNSMECSTCTFCYLSALIRPAIF